MIEVSQSSRQCLADWDGTLRCGFLAIAWIDYLVEHDLFPKSSRALLHRMLDSYRSARLAYEALVAQVGTLYAAGMKGALRSEIDSIAHAFVLNDRQHLYPYVEVLLQFLHDNAVHTSIVSGAPEEPLRAYAKVLHIGSIWGLSLGSDENGRYTGTVDSNFGLKQSKLKIADTLKAQGSEVLLAIGNSCSDRPLFDVAALRVWMHDGTVPIPNWGKRMMIIEPNGPFDDLYTAVSRELCR